MLKQTLDAVSRLDYPNFECVVIIQQHARSGVLGSRSRIIAGRSASASSSSTPKRCRASRPAPLRIAMERTAVDAEIIGIIDADYMVEAGTG